VNLATAKLVFCRRLGRSWLDLADAVGIRPDERATFEPGQEGRQIWEWLEFRDRLPALPTALRQVDREDLADEIDQHWRATSDGAESSSATDDSARSRRSRFGGPRHRWRGFRNRNRRQKWAIGTSLVLVLSLIPGGGLLWRGTTDIRAREDHRRGQTAERTAVPTGSPSPPASRPSRPESTWGSSAERTRAIENMKLRAKAATPHLKSNVVQKLSESVYCNITMIRSLYGARNFVTPEYKYAASLEGLLRASRPAVLYSTESFILCDDQDAGATYIRSYRNLYVFLAASGKDPDLLRAGAGVANLEGFEWTGDFRGGLSTLRSLRTGRYVTMDAGACTVRELGFGYAAC